ncbi:protein MIS12-like [Citrus sinensis]|uniref:Protein MIS12-like n=1 Tax=Citrus sinensis TaxID=2711 RepID=A0ACB8LYN7_CITSI|nr:protein MIS12-like [Citrus sinensis]
MEGSESEAVFNSLNLNPQLFINETLNTVDDLVDEAFNFYLQQASTLLKTEDTDKSQDLSKGVAYIRNLIQLALDKRLSVWEKYCLHHCFSVPEGFSLPKSVVEVLYIHLTALHSNIATSHNLAYLLICRLTSLTACLTFFKLNELPCESSLCQDAFNDSDLDVQMDSLRDKLAAVGKESSELSRELQALEKQSSATDHSAGLVSEALQLYDQNSVHDLFQEMVKTASELHMKMHNLKTKRMNDMQHIKVERVNNADRGFCSLNRGKGLYNANLEGIQDCLAELKKM